jgi:hypothetical protein
MAALRFSNDPDPADKNDLVAQGLLLAHTSDIHAAGIRRRYIRVIPAVRVPSSSKSTQAIWHKTKREAC